MTQPYDPLRALACLHRHDVEFVLIGGLAAVVHGSPLATFDTDITPRRAAGNLQRLAAALRELNARIRTSTDPVVCPIDAEFLAAQPHMLNLTTDAGDLDLSFTPAGSPTATPGCARAPWPSRSSRARRQRSRPCVK